MLSPPPALTTTSGERPYFFASAGRSVPARALESDSGPRFVDGYETDPRAVDPLDSGPRAVSMEPSPRTVDFDSGDTLTGVMATAAGAIAMSIEPMIANGISLRMGHPLM